MICNRRKQPCQIPLLSIRREIFSPMTHHVFCLCLVAGLTSVYANSIGKPGMCYAKNPALGCSAWNRNAYGQWDPQDCGAGNHNKLMPWTVEPRHAPDLFTLEAAGGVCEYVPGEFISLILVSHSAEMFRGMMMYAVNDTEKETRVGSWHLPTSSAKKFWTPFANEPGHPCGPVLMHSSAEVKTHHEVLRFRAPPAGTGSITFRCLLKTDVANTGGFYWPNDEDLVLHEAPVQSQKWILGAPGQSCTVACGTQRRSCDGESLEASVESITYAIDGLRECRVPLLASCNAATPP